MHYTEVSCPRWTILRYHVLDELHWGIMSLMHYTVVSCGRWTALTRDKAQSCSDDRQLGVLQEADEDAHNQTAGNDQQAENAKSSASLQPVFHWKPPSPSRDVVYVGSVLCYALCFCLLQGKRKEYDAQKPHSIEDSRLLYYLIREIKYVAEQ